MLGALVVFFPEGKISLGNSLSLKITPFERLFVPDTSQQVDVQAIVSKIETVDSLIENLSGTISAKLENEKVDVPLHREIQLPVNNPSAMLDFYNALKETSATGKLLHIIHYGDSQLEGDRISDYLRNKLQLIFGGYGPGVILPIDVSRSRISIRQSESPDCIKYSVYGNNPRDTAGLYGIGGSTYVFTGNGRKRIGTDTLVKKVFIHTTTKIPDKAYPDSAELAMYVDEVDSSKYYWDTTYVPLYQSIKKADSWVKLHCAKASYPRVRKFEQVKILYQSRTAQKLTVQLDDSIRNIVLPPAHPVGEYTFNDLLITEGVDIRILSGEPTRFYGFSLDGKSGVQVDNFPMRGSSGTGFERIRPDVLKKQCELLNAKLIIMQFGINVVPNPQKNYGYYQKMFSAQLAALRRALPDVSILVIGPSDMSTKENGLYTSYPNIPLIRDAMKNAAFENGCAFWDLYEAMGGKNSMVSWVQSDPPLAGKDFTHFTGQGARYVGEMLYDALIKSYLNYLKEPLP